jgi:hypothetical protein
MMDALNEADRLDDFLEFLETIPGVLNSKLVQIPASTFANWPGFRHALQGFLHRTLSSNFILESVINRRLDIYLSTNNMIFGPMEASNALFGILTGKFGRLPQTIETANTLARWCTSYHKKIAMAARCVVASILQSSQVRDERWVMLATDKLGIPKDEFHDTISRGDDSASLAIFNHITHQIIITTPWQSEALSSLSRFNILNTLPELQNKFCALWNGLVVQGMSQVYHYDDDDSDFVDVLRVIRHLYIALHQGTHAAPTAFDASTTNDNPILFRLSSYPLCEDKAHQQNTAIPHPTQHHDSPDAFLHPSQARSESQPIPGSSTAPQQAEEVDVVQRHPPPAEFYAPHSQGHPSTSPTTDLVHVPLQIASVTHPSIHQSIQMAALDLIRLFSMEVSPLLRPSSPSSGDLTANVVRPNPLPDPLPVTGIPYIVPHPPSVSMQQQLGDFLGNFVHYTCPYTVSSTRK